MKAQECCGRRPEIEIHYDLDECSIRCFVCGRQEVKRQIGECIRAWNAEETK
jgi:hypothetical protein